MILYKHIKTSHNKLKRLEKHGLIKTIEDTDGINKVVLHTLEEYIKKEKEIQRDYLTIGQTVRTLIQHKYKIKGELKLDPYKKNIFNLINKNILTSMEFDNKTYITKMSVNHFLCNYISHEEALNKLNAGHVILYKIIKANDLEKIKISAHHIFYHRVTLEALISNYNYKVLPDDTRNKGTLIKGKLYNTIEFYPTSEVRKILNLTKAQWKLLKKEQNIDSIIFGGIRHYKKQHIDELKIHQMKLRNNYYTWDEVEEMMNLKGTIGHSKIINSRELSPTIFRGLSDKKIRYIYPKKVVDEIVLENQIKKHISSCTNYIESYNYCLNNLNIPFVETKSQTLQQWKHFIRKILRDTNESYETIHSTIFKYVKCTEMIVEFLTKKEIYEFTSNDINLNLLNNQIPTTYQRVFYSFIKSNYKNLIATSKNKLFKLENILNPYQIKSDPRNKTIYPFEEYKALFHYANNIPFHKDKAINAAEKQIYSTNKEKLDGIPQKVNYDSSWLYVLIHLNNAWRHKDIVRLPRINLNVLSTKNINLTWLKNNDLSYEDARNIILQLMRKDLKTTKTNAANHFFCSTELTISLATAAVICELRRSAITPNYEYLINFRTKKNEFTSPIKKIFFKEFENDFNFENLKMNRSLLSYTYYLLVKKGNSQAALEVAQRLRAHYNLETTNIYIYIYF